MSDERASDSEASSADTGPSDAPDQPTPAADDPAEPDEPEDDAGGEADEEDGWGGDEETEVFEYSDEDEADGDEADGALDEARDGGLYDAPPLPAGVSVAVAGVLCGFATVGMVWLSGRGCDAASGAPNCGSLGLPLLLATVVVTIAIGVVLLRRLMLPSPGLVSFLGVCFMLLIVVAFLSERLFTPWTLLVVPAISAVTFLIARYVTQRLNA